MRKLVEASVESRRDFLAQACALAALSIAGGPADAALHADDRAARMLTAIAATIYPHAALPRSVYARVAAALLAKAQDDSSTRRTLDAGLEDLDGSAGGDWLSLAAATQLKSLVMRQNAPFFQLVRGTTAATLYSDPEVWKLFGYGGDAWSFGGYSGKALNDIDWLPEPVEP